MTVSPIACPECGASLRRFRSVPGRLGRLLKFRLYDCAGCNRIFETSEVVTRSAPADQSKRYISRVEINRTQRKDKSDGGSVVVDDEESVDGSSNQEQVEVDDGSKPAA